MSASRLIDVAQEIHDAKQAVPRAFARLAAAQRELQAAQEEVNRATFAVQAAESRILSVWREEVGTVPRQRKLELDTARYTQSDVRL